MRAARPTAEGAGALPGDNSLEELERLGLIRVLRSSGGGRKIGVRHDRVAQAVLASMDAERRRERHGAMAAAMEEERVPVDSGVMAEHLRRYRDDERAAAYALAAADQAMEQLAFSRAAGLYRMAVELSRGNSGSELHVKFAEALRLSGRAVEAAGEYLNAIRVGGVQRVGELQLRAAEQFLITGHIDRGINILKHVFRGLKLKLPERAGSALFSSLRFPRAESATFRRRPQAEIPTEELLRVDAYWTGAVGLISTDPERSQLMQRRHLRAALPLRRCQEGRPGVRDGGLLGLLRWHPDPRQDRAAAQDVD